MSAPFPRHVAMLALIFVLTLVGFGTFGPDARAQSLESVVASLEDGTQKRNVVSALRKFRVLEDRASKRLLGRLSNRERYIQKNSVGLQGKPLLDQIGNVRAWMKQGGAFPVASDLLEDIVPYAKEVAEAKSKLAPPVHALLNRLENDGEKISIRRVQEAFDDTGKILDADATFVVGSVWAGHRMHAGKKTEKFTVRFRVKDVKGKEFSGLVERGYAYGGHPIYNCSGSIEGAGVIARTGTKSAVANRDDGNWTYQGYVFGRTFIGQFSGIDARGKRGQGTFRVDRVK